MGLFRKDKTCIIAKFCRADLLIRSHSREGKPPSYSQINKVNRATEIDKCQSVRQYSK